MAETLAQAVARLHRELGAISARLNGGGCGKDPMPPATQDEPPATGTTGPGTGGGGGDESGGSGGGGVPPPPGGG